MTPAEKTYALRSHLESELVELQREQLALDGRIQRVKDTINALQSLGDRQLAEALNNEGRRR